MQRAGQGRYRRKQARTVLREAGRQGAKHGPRNTQHAWPHRKNAAVLHGAPQPLAGACIRSFVRVCVRAWQRTAADRTDGSSDSMRRHSAISGTERGHKSDPPPAAPRTAPPAASLPPPAAPPAAPPAPASAFIEARALIGPAKAPSVGTVGAPASSAPVSVPVPVSAAHTCAWTSVGASKN